MNHRPTLEELKNRVRELEKEAAKARTAEEASRESEKLFSQIIQASPIPTFVMDRSHTITHCNKAYENLVGLPAEKIIGTHKEWLDADSKETPFMADFIVDDAPEEEMTWYYGGKCRKSRLIEGAYEAEDFFPKAGEKGKWLLLTAAPLKDAKGRIVAAIETLQDITERRVTEEALKESEKTLSQIVEGSSIATFVINNHHVMTHCNRAFENLTGIRRGTILGTRGQWMSFYATERPVLADFIVDKASQEEIANYYGNKCRKSSLNDGAYEAEDFYPDLGGGGKWLFFTAAPILDDSGNIIGAIETLQDVTEEKRIALTNEVMLRISLALPEYPDLEDLLYYINSEVKRLLGTEGAIVILLEEMKQELFILGAAYDDMDTERRAKRIRFAMNELIAGRVIQSGEPIIVSSLTQDRELHEERDRRLGYKTKNLAIVPIQSSERIIGAICAINKKLGDFDEKDLDLLSTIAGTIALSVENARFAEEIKKAYLEVKSLNSAKDKVINHLSHELRTPVAILSGSLNILTRRLESLPESTWKPTLERVQRNLDRVVDIQYQVQDIMENREYKAGGLLSLLLETCSDELQTLVAEQVGEGPLVERIRKRINEVFDTKEAVSRELRLDETVKERIQQLKPHYSHREVEVTLTVESTPPVFLPPDVLQKVIDGLIRNAIENTPDEARIEVTVRKKGDGTELVVHDYGIGILEDARRRIFEGFFTTIDTMSYSTKKPFDFMAGGKGADLLRMKIFSERYHFKIEMTSTRCRHIPKETDVCPGRISQCPYCSKIEDCHRTAGTTFTLYFPPASLQKA